MADVGMESTLAGAASRLFSATSAAAVYWAIIRPESTPVPVSEERWQALRSVGIEHAVGPALRHRSHIGQRDGQEVGHVGQRRTVEIVVRRDLPVGEHDRVVDGRAQLARADTCSANASVAGGTVHLGAQRRE